MIAAGVGWQPAAKWSNKTESAPSERGDAQSVFTQPAIERIDALDSGYGGHDRGAASISWTVTEIMEGNIDDLRIRPDRCLRIAALTWGCGRQLSCGDVSFHR
jgi:hypothetical protein